MADIESCMQENVGECSTTNPSILDDLVRETNSVLLPNLKEKGSGSFKEHSIYKIPEGLVGDEKKRSQAYKPELVSLGPYHHGEEQVVAMEKNKVGTVCCLLQRTNKKLEDYWEALAQGAVLQQMMDSYEDLDPSWKEDKERFLKLMILDGCFLLEVLRLTSPFFLRQHDGKVPMLAPNGLIPNMPRIRRDMLKLENQIPLLVLHKLFLVAEGVIHDKEEEITKKAVSSEKEKQRQEYLIRQLNWMVLDFLTPGRDNESFVARHHHSALHVLDLVRKRMITTDVTRLKGLPCSALHVLDLVRKQITTDVTRLKGLLCWYSKKPRAININFNMLAATNLEDAGIRFTKSNTQSLEDITFQTGVLCATLSLPLLLVDDATETKFLNLMAFEHLHADAGNEVTTYAHFMEFIIKSYKDARLLSKNNIIENSGMRTDQDIASLFNGLTLHWKSLNRNSRQFELFVDVVAYCSTNSLKGVRESLVDLRRNYFKSPWTLISLIGGFLLFVLTSIQTVYAILQYNNRR